MGRQLHGDLQIIASGGKLYSFLNAMQSAGICCRKQQCRGNSYRFYIYEKARKPVQALAEQYGVTLQITSQKTLRYFLHRYRFRFGIPAGLLLVAGLLFYGSNIIMTIDVIGNETVSEQEIRAVLQEDNVQRGSWIPSLDLANCEHHLRAGIESLAWVGIRHTGNRLVVEVMEATPQPEMLRSRVPCNVVAERDAQIVSFTVQSGQVKRLTGDLVRKGDLLISGVWGDEFGHVFIRHAMGQVEGIYEQTEVFSCDFVQQQRAPAADQTICRYLDLFTWHIPLGTTENPYADYVKTASTHWFSLLGQELPIGVYEETYTACRTHTLEFTPEEAEQNLAEQKQRYEENFLQDVMVLDQKKTALETESGLQWEITYTLQGEIGRQQELYLQD